jgi:hypothetical protein
MNSIWIRAAAFGFSALMLTAAYKRAEPSSVMADAANAFLDSLWLPSCLCFSQQYGVPRRQTSSGLWGDDLFEPFEATFDATTKYLNVFVMPRLQAAIASATER